MFGDPFSNELIKLISPMVESVIPTLPEEVPRPKIHVNKTAVVMEGYVLPISQYQIEAHQLTASLTAYW